ncbi:MAG: hypothetical protein M0C28_16795 [Candidatus Moduliflexus flocculans]|nr:hypothetical protein [Candidatus Moduliflexus flocculans]
MKCIETADPRRTPAGAGAPGRQDPYIRRSFHAGVGGGDGPACGQQAQGAFPWLPGVVHHPPSPDRRTGRPSPEDRQGRGR